jgi:PAS domain S-box-containing protein
MKPQLSLTGHERSFPASDVIVTKTDLKGRITYANQCFLGISGLTEEQALGAPHSIIRHPDMPRCVFKLLWDQLEDGKEVFAYVINRAMNGDHYWVFAHVTPSFDGAGKVVAYHSNRRVPKKTTIDQVIRPLYDQLRQIESLEADRKVGMNRATDALRDKLQSQRISYDQFIFSI